MRPSWLTACLVIAFAMLLPLTPPVRADGGLLYVSVNLRDAPFEEALRQLFSGGMLGFADYVVESGPDEGAVATIKIENKPGERTTATDALVQVLAQYGLSYRWVGRTVYIFRKGTQATPEGGLLLYLRRNGDRLQLRLRASPYERGGEKLLWESPKDIFQEGHLLPSPSFRSVLVAWYGATWDESGEGGPQLLLVPVAGGAVRRVPVPEAADRVFWVKEGELYVVGAGGERWRYQTGVGKLTRLSAEEAPPKDVHDEQVAALEGLLRRAKLPIAFPRDGSRRAVEATVSGQLNRGANTWAPPQATISPDGRYAALVGAEAAVYVLDVATGAIVRKLPATRLVDTEGVALGQLHWSADSAHLVFTESHYHAARWHPMGGPVAQAASVTDWTELVREYTPATGRTETLTVGFDAYRVPAEAAKQILTGSDPYTWEAAEDQDRWGRYAGQRDAGE